MNHGLMRKQVLRTNYTPYNPNRNTCCWSTFIIRVLVLAANKLRTQGKISFSLSASSISTQLLAAFLPRTPPDTTHRAFFCLFHVSTSKIHIGEIREGQETIHCLTGNTSKFEIYLGIPNYVLCSQSANPGCGSRVCLNWAGFCGFIHWTQIVSHNLSMTHKLYLLYFVWSYVWNALVSQCREPRQPRVND